MLRLVRWGCCRGLVGGCRELRSWVSVVDWGCCGTVVVDWRWFERGEMRLTCGVAVGRTATVLGWGSEAVGGSCLSWWRVRLSAAITWRSCVVAWVFLAAAGTGSFCLQWAERRNRKIVPGFQLQGLFWFC